MFSNVRWQVKQSLVDSFHTCSDKLKTVDIQCQTVLSPSADECAGANLFQSSNELKTATSDLVDNIDINFKL